MNTQKNPRSAAKKQREGNDGDDKTTPPNSEPVTTGKRRRLARAFSYPLDEALRKKDEPVRERFSLLKTEYDTLIARKEQLVDQGVDVKKRDLVRLGLQLLNDKTDGEILILLNRLPKIPESGKK
ncbi:hypothetical protein [Propionivibrio dicarboxylicus]|uniref:Uncharacterized protein n=1 Tax=Propionivibrio dicarboxylicus TaxID=83767 RepID=A0A1G7VB05_9RHOO|nr:hypothetical protein [Propionivibrio dicarboxylicus]SDG56933.1 hypothetical protein SAMN05660652_00147 [Propionivibrio dicarboxylicus]